MAGPGERKSDFGERRKEPERREKNQGKRVLKGEMERGKRLEEDGEREPEKRGQRRRG